MYSRRDGQRYVRVESRLDCLAADASLEQLQQVSRVQGKYEVVACSNILVLQERLGAVGIK